MILAVEGISTSGKTTWCRRHAPGRTVPENGRMADAPDRASDPARAAAFWADRNADRWQAALRLEAVGGAAVCDTDPLKLHYVWTLWQIGEASADDWKAELTATRALVAAGQLGWADAYLVGDVDETTARVRRQGDNTRSRRNFDLHFRLRSPLIAWYRTLEQVRPGSVTFGFPDELPQVTPVHPRYDLAAFDRMIAALPL